MLINRLRKWVHRNCELERGMASALLSVGEQLAHLSGGMLLLRQALERVPERVTVLALGQREAGEVPIVVDSKTVRLRGERTETITLETHFPIELFQVVVLADFDRVELAGLFHRTDLLGMQSPIGFGKGWHPGEQVRALVRRLEVG